MDEDKEKNKTIIIFFIAVGIVSLMGIYLILNNMLNEDNQRIISCDENSAMQCVSYCNYQAQENNYIKGCEEYYYDFNKSEDKG